MVFLVYDVLYRLFLDENENMPKHEMKRCYGMGHLFSDAKIATASGAAKDNLCYLHKTKKLRYQSSDLSQHNAYFKKLPLSQVIVKCLF